MGPMLSNMLIVLAFSAINSNGSKKSFFLQFLDTRGYYECPGGTCGEDEKPNIKKRNQLSLLPVLDFSVSTSLCWFAFLAGHSALVWKR